MFSRRVVPHTLEAFPPFYEQMIAELRCSRSVGEQIIAEDLSVDELLTLAKRVAAQAV